jgi:lambda repressor-like predicted transcriptional regulator
LPEEKKNQLDKNTLENLLSNAIQKEEFEIATLIKGTLEKKG